MVSFEQFLAHNETIKTSHAVAFIMPPSALWAYPGNPRRIPRRWACSLAVRTANRMTR